MIRGRNLLKIKVWPVGLALILAAGAMARAQGVAGSGGAGKDGADLPPEPAPTPAVLQLPYTPDVATPSALPLSLDDAIARGMNRNLNVQLSRQNELTVHGQILNVGNALLPNMELDIK